MYGWMGTILRVDLTSGKIEKEPLSEELGRNYLGGRGINVRILYNEVPAGLDAYDPENRLIFGTGPLTGTSLASGRLNITAKSPLSNILGCSNGGSHFSPELKFAGYDHVVFTGKADKPVYLCINNDKVEIRDARHLWGETTDETERMIREELGDPNIQVTSIGPAGENLVRFACIVVGEYGACGKCGLGAVMGSKNLKAVAVRGTKGVKVARPDVFRDLVLDLQQRALRNTNYPVVSKYGTTRLLRFPQRLGTQAIRNSTQAGPFAGYDKIGPEALDEKYAIKDKACLGCINHCRSWYEIKDGPYAGEKGVGIEYACEITWGVICDNDYAPSLYKGTKLCNQLGLDLREMGMVLAACMEWYEKGLITKEDTGGIELTWGNYEAMIEICRKVAKREGIGDLLAEGGIRVAQKLGRGAENCITHSKGILQTTSDVRWNPYYMLGLAVATRGADHLRGAATVSTAKDGSRAGVYEGAAQAVYSRQTLGTIADSLEVCKFSTTWSGMELTVKVLAELFSLATGIDVDEKEISKIADRIWTLERAFIVREGISRKDDVLVGRLANEPMHGGPYDGLKVDRQKWDKMIDEYYDFVGWDKETGVPTRATLESLGLGEVADELARMGKL